LLRDAPEHRGKLQDVVGEGMTRQIGGEGCAPIFPAMVCASSMSAVVGRPRTASHELVGRLRPVVASLSGAAVTVQA
jgi:hypothetical protein